MSDISCKFRCFTIRWLTCPLCCMYIINWVCSWYILFSFCNLLSTIEWDRAFWGQSTIFILRLSKENRLAYLSLTWSLIIVIISFFRPGVFQSHITSVQHDKCIWFVWGPWDHQPIAYTRPAYKVPCVTDWSLHGPATSSHTHR